MPRFKDRTNDRYGRLLVLSHAGKDDRNKHLWLCQCDCGNKKIVVSDNLSSGKSKSCGCLKMEFLSKSGNQFGLYEDREAAILKVQYSHLKRRSLKKSKTCTVMGFDDFRKMSLMPCFYCGVEGSKRLEDRTNERSNGKLMSDTIVICNGIDRVDSSLGYTVENCVPCCKHCNTAKSTMSVNEFLSWVARVHSFSNINSTGVACVNTNRGFIGIELDENYFNIAKQRINS